MLVCKCLGCIALDLVEQRPYQFNGLTGPVLAEALIDSAERSGYSLYQTIFYYKTHKRAERLAEKGPQLTFGDLLAASASAERRRPAGQPLERIRR